MSNTIIYIDANSAVHNYSWVFVDLPKDAQQIMLPFTKDIDKEDLYIKEGDAGIEKDPHITVKYGLETDDLKMVKEQIAKEKGGKIYLGKSTIFEGDEYDVVKIDVESEALSRLHEKLNTLPHADKHAEYHAHATIAYVKSGKGKKYLGKFKVDKSFKFDEVFFGDRDSKNHSINLKSNINWYGLYK